MAKPLFTGRRIVVLGLGLHGGGVAVTKWLVKNKAKVTVTDIKTKDQLASSLKQLKGLPITYVLGKHPVSLLENCDLVIQNPGVPEENVFLNQAKKRGIAIENEASLFLKLCPTKKIVAVTGTRGKSTTVSLLGQIMRSKVGHTVVAGNIRDTLLFDVLDKLNDSSTVVLELSSWQLEMVGKYNLRIPAAIVTNVLPDHLNRYRNFSAYARAKASIFRGQKYDDVLVLNYDNVVTRNFSRQAKAKVYWFSQRKKVVRGCYAQSGRVYWRDGDKTKFIFSRDDISVVGDHNLANVLAASTAGLTLGMGVGKIRAAVKKFKGLHDRLEFVRKINKVVYYNDTTSTSPDAAIAALRSFTDKPIVLIAGGTDKKLLYDSMARTIRHQAVKVILLPGTATVKLQQALKGYKEQLLALTMNQAVRLAKQLAAPGAVVLLSPGAASFGLFLHEFDRGEKFKQAVKSLS